MPSSLLVEPMNEHDFDLLSDLDLISEDDLSPPAVMMCWPPSTPENNVQRTRWREEPGANNQVLVQHGLNGAAHETLIRAWNTSRPDWCVHGPQWMLTTLKTKEPERRRGAGGMLVEWGVQQAKKEGIPAYLEAVPEAKSLYEKFGFKQIGEQIVDLRPCDIPLVLVIARMMVDVE
ncbi:MAG: hypothetical protein M1820_002535 [Bogoriella megaspora]|nr:MAG: hypothetical protein M1820_002535 [Bogoriella megaspora]